MPLPPPPLLLINAKKQRTTVRQPAPAALHVLAVHCRHRRVAFRGHLLPRRRAQGRDRVFGAFLLRGRGPKRRGGTHSDGGGREGAARGRGRDREHGEEGRSVVFGGGKKEGGRVKAERESEKKWSQHQNVCLI